MSGDNSAPVAEGEVHRVEIKEYGDQGDGVAFIDSFVVFIPNTQVSDEIYIMVTYVGDRSARGYQVELPSDTSLPFFAYGIFRRGEIAYHRIHDYVAVGANNNEVQDATIRGDLIVEDGMARLIPLSNSPERERFVTGNILSFTDGKALDGYATVAASEPMAHCNWMKVETVDGIETNTLIVNPEHEIENISGKRLRPSQTKLRWGSKSYFEDVMTVVSKVWENNYRLRDTSEFFRLQMGYLLLWSILERYISLAWGELSDDHVKEKRERFARTDQGFARGLSEVFEEGIPEPYRIVSRSDDPATRISINVTNPESVINYLYQVRSNVTHRGKGERTSDEELLRQSFYDLYILSCAVLEQRYTEISIPTMQSEFG